MDRGFNNLSSAEYERIAIFLEECGEAVQIAGKILRHGMECYNPFDESKTTNRYLLEKEIGHILYATGLLARNNDISYSRINDHTFQKGQDIVKYLHHNEP